MMKMTNKEAADMLDRIWEEDLGYYTERALKALEMGANALRKLKEDDQEEDHGES